MKDSVYGFLLALQFLTRLPVPFSCPWNTQTSRWAIRSYPLIGIILGALLFLVMDALAPSVSLLMAALMTISLWVWLTGALHLDGWMDAADAIGSNAPLEKKWEIMKDPHVGSFGIVSLLFLLAWKLMFIYVLFDQFDQHIVSLLVILALSRFGAVLLLFFLPSAKPTGLAWEWKRNINGLDVCFAAIPAVILLVFLDQYLFLLPSFLFFILGYGWWVKHLFKGINGDLLGAAIEGGELWGLAAVWIYFSIVMG